jgi:hypothetical protein
MKTVNVLETVNLINQCLSSFPDTILGNIQAEILFKQLAKENGMTKEETTVCIEDGYYEKDDYNVSIIHSIN